MNISDGTRFLAVVLLCTFIIHTSTLNRSPPAWQDEVQILDYGRTLLANSDQSYGANWSAEKRPIQLFSYLGGLVQEIAYQTWPEGGSTGPRLASLIGAIVAAVGLNSWLQATGTASRVSAVASCAFLWDPLVVAGYRGARVDVWCMALMFTALCCIRQSCRGRLPVIWLLTAALFVAASGLVWPSAILLVPLLVYELYQSALSANSREGDTSQRIVYARFIASTLILGLGSVFFLLLLLLPFLDTVSSMLADLRGGVHVTVAEQHDRLSANALAVPRLFAMSPWLPLLALGGIGFLGPRSWFIPTVAALCGVVATRAYGHRAVYLVPYFAYGCAMTFDHLARLSAGRGVVRQPAVWLAILLLGWAGSISLIVRTVSTLNDWDRRDPALAKEAIKGLLGGSEVRVLLGSWNLYYAVRSRGWRYWGPYDLRTTDEIAASLDYDYVIHDQSSGRHPLASLLRERNYTQQVVDAHAVGSSAWTWLPNGTAGYGPYVIYTSPDRGMENSAPR